MTEQTTTTTTSTTADPIPVTEVVVKNPVPDATVSVTTTAASTAAQVPDPKIQVPVHVNRFLATLSLFWDWFDQRDIEKHTTASAVMYVTYKVIFWSMSYAELAVNHPGLDIAAVIAAVNAPMLALQAAVVSFYFKSRTVA